MLIDDFSKQDCRQADPLNAIQVVIGGVFFSDSSSRKNILPSVKSVPINLFIFPEDVIRTSFPRTHRDCAALHVFCGTVFYKR